jgi:hypothetical protein
MKEGSKILMRKLSKRPTGEVHILIQGVRPTTVERASEAILAGIRRELVLGREPWRERERAE